MKVALIDPSLFTIPYDAALGGALAAEGCEIAFYGRPPRAHESVVGGPAMRPHFYRLSERLYGRVPVDLGRLAKGAEHVLDMLRLRREAAARRFDIVHFQWAPLPVLDKRLVRLFRRHAPVVMTVHDTTPFNGSANNRLQKLDSLSVFAAFDHLIVHTDGGKAQLAARGLPESRISVIPHGILATAPAAPRAAPVGGDKTILLFGKIKHYKGLDLLIEAFGRLPAPLRAGARLKIVGEPFVDIAALRARAAALGIADRIDWDLRYVPDGEIGGLLAGADVLAFPYREIDVSGVLMACFPYGKPIVASRVGGFARLLEDGVSGRLVPPEDPAALAAALRDVLADPVAAARLGAGARALVDGVPGWDEIARRTIGVYRSLVAARRPAPVAAATGRRSVPT
jgi:glycosyltransferase involved in cell wall biosynthesis